MQIKWVLQVIISLILTVPTFFLTMFVGDLGQVYDLDSRLFIAFILSSIVYFYAGMEFQKEPGKQFYLEEQTWMF